MSPVNQTVTPDKSTDALILIVDDNSVNRKILNKNLELEYRVLQAADGRQALELIRQYHETLSGIILDLVMPVMDGFAVLAEINSNDAYRGIPVIVATGNGNEEHETRALRLGAWDFVTKPYNMGILNFRLKNAISRSRESALQRLKYLAEFDPLTGIYNKRMFFQLTREMLLSHQEQFVLVRFDVDNFKLINSTFGVADGDSVLQQLADVLRRYAAENPLITYGHIEADAFCLCMPFLSREDAGNAIEQLRLSLLDVLSPYRLVPKFGLQVIADPTADMETIYDKTVLAVRQCKGNYLKNYAFFEPRLMEDVQRESLLAGEMQRALDNGEFVVYYQPKYIARTGVPDGAEALVRWKHPHLGMISPGEFIPLFERNGFISKLDRYVWEQVCKMLSLRAQEGKPLHPISVNVSRVDFYGSPLVDTFVDLTRRYDIPPECLNLEITESAYVENPVVIQETVTQLHQHGFVVMMDDFGSGYSSMTMLKDLTVDILKIDMKFLPQKPNPRADRILACVVSMSRWLGMAVVVEGVETADQVRFLRDIGCDYIQGYYYAKPMPQEDFERLINTLAPSPLHSECKAVDFHALSDITANSDSLFHALPVPASVLAIDQEGQITIFKTNPAFVKAFGYDENCPYQSRDFLNSGQLTVIHRAIEAALNSRAEAQCAYLRTDLDGRRRRHHLLIKYLGVSGGFNLLVCALPDASKNSDDEEIR